jgi:hypothetical protein
MRNTPLALVRSMIKAESGKSLDSTSTALDTQINQIVANIQSGLASQYDWPFLKSRWDVTISPGSRYTVFPSTNSVSLACNPNLERPITAEVKWNAVWQPIIYGIDEIPEFNYLDSDKGQVLDPIQRWQFSDELNFEVWPLPASQAQVRFIGQRALTKLYTATYQSSGGDASLSLNVARTWTPAVNSTGTYYVGSSSVGYLNFLPAANVWVLSASATTSSIATALYSATTITGTWAVTAHGTSVGLTSAPTFVLVATTSWNDSATLDLDDLLVAYYAATEYLSRETDDSAQAKFVLGKAQQRLLSLLGSYPVRTQVTTIGRGMPLDRKAIRQIPMVVVAGGK